MTNIQTDRLGPGLVIAYIMQVDIQTDLEPALIKAYIVQAHTDDKYTDRQTRTSCIIDYIMQVDRQADLGPAFIEAYIA